jgi:hypothetical protein
MKVRSKKSGKVYDIDAVYVKGSDLILPLNEVEVLTEDQQYNYVALRNEVAAKLITAASDLLDALVFAGEIIDRLCEDYSMVANRHANFTTGEYNRIMRAIKKATELIEKI